jgi:hypothetical protein
VNLNLGADKKKTTALIAIVVLGGALVWYENSSDDTPAGSSAPRPTAAAPAVLASRGAAADRRRASAKNSSNEFQPRLGPRTPEERRDPATIDPTLRLDLLTKVQAVELGPPGRNLFDFGSAPAPMPAVPKVDTKIATNHPPVTLPPPGPVTPPGPPPPPAAPQMTFKYYGFKVSKTDGHKAAFLLDGDDILVAGENDTIKRRYKVVRIGVNSITIEDTQFKSTQTLTLQEGPAA